MTFVAKKRDVFVAAGIANNSGSFFGWPLIVDASKPPDLTADRLKELSTWWYFAAFAPRYRLLDREGLLEKKTYTKKPMVAEFRVIGPIWVMARVFRWRDWPSPQQTAKIADALLTYETAAKQFNGGTSPVAQLNAVFSTQLVDWSPPESLTGLPASSVAVPSLDSAEWTADLAAEPKGSGKPRYSFPRKVMKMVVLLGFTQPGHTLLDDLHKLPGGRVFIVPGAELREWAPTMATHKDDPFQENKYEYAIELHPNASDWEDRMYNAETTKNIGSLKQLLSKLAKKDGVAKDFITVLSKPIPDPAFIGLGHELCHAVGDGNGRHALQKKKVALSELATLQLIRAFLDNYRPDGKFKGFDVKNGPGRRASEVRTAGLLKQFDGKPAMLQFVQDGVYGEFLSDVLTVDRNEREQRREIVYNYYKEQQGDLTVAEASLVAAAKKSALTLREFDCVLDVVRRLVEGADEYVTCDSPPDVEFTENWLRAAYGLGQRVSHGSVEPIPKDLVPESQKPPSMRKNCDAGRSGGGLDYIQLPEGDLP